jgi:hypothetical protein
MANNKQLVIYDQTATDAPGSATGFYGFGINAATLRYQAPTATQSHKFFCGSTQSFTITNGTGANGSDKVEIRNRRYNKCFRQG